MFLGLSTFDAEAADHHFMIEWSRRLQSIRDRATGIGIDREQRRVTVPARTTEVWAQDPVEFILIPLESGKDYEALAVTRISPSAVHRALEEIGLKPGRPVNERMTRFWPRGARLRIMVEWQDEEGEPRRERVGALLLDRRTGEPLPDEGFLFTGSRMITIEGEEKPVYAADRFEPMSIISTYNDPETVIDLPYQAGQDVQYGNIIKAPGDDLPKGTEVRFIIEPWPGPHADPAIDIHMDVGQKTAQDRTEPVIQVKLREHGGRPVIAARPSRFPWIRVNMAGRIGQEKVMSSADVITYLGDLAQQGYWPYVHVYFGDDLKIPLAAAFCRLLSLIDSPRGIRVDERPENHLYYRALVPHAGLYDREDRGLQPPELHLRREDGVLSAMVKEIRREWDSELSRFGPIEIIEHPLSSPDRLGDVLKETGTRLRILLVYTGADVTYGDVMKYLLQVMDDYPTIFVLPPQAD